MFNNIVKSASFGINFALSNLFGNKMKASGKLPVWLETALHFFAAFMVYLLLCFIVDFIRSNLPMSDEAED